MSRIFPLSSEKNATADQSIYETGTATLFLQGFCTAPFVSSLSPDAGLHAFARLPERERQLLQTIAKRPDSVLTLAYTAQSRIIGQVALVPAEGRWQEFANTYEIALEVSVGWRRRGIARQLLGKVFELECLDDLILIGMGLRWHWDTLDLGLSPLAYRAMIEQLLAPYGFTEYLTSDEDIRMDPTNIFLARLGCRVALSDLSLFYERLLQSKTLPGM